MKKVAPELESLMWTLAEEGNERAIDEFGTRHPELRAELLHRIAMIKGLRGEKRRAAEPTKSIPRFVPKAEKPKGPVYVVGGLVLAAVCALAYAVETFVTPPPHFHPGDGPLPVEVRNVQPPPKVQPTPKSSPIPDIDESRVPARQVDADLKPGSLRIEHAPLQTVLMLMSEECKVKITPAPGMPNPDVTVDYKDMTALEMLRDLGHQYGFTPFDQHDGSILVVPAVDQADPGLGGGSTGNMNHRKVGG